MYSAEKTRLARQAKAMDKIERGVETAAAKVKDANDVIGAAMAEGGFIDDGVTVPKAAKDCPWTAGRDEDGKLYFTNKETSESTFDMPKDFKIAT